MARAGRSDPKVEALRAARSLNPRPEAVSDEAFSSSEFLDPRDLVQVKYEMVRKVRQRQASIASAAAAFGFSRQSYYDAAKALHAGGLAAVRWAADVDHAEPAALFATRDELRRERRDGFCPAEAQAGWPARPRLSHCRSGHVPDAIAATLMGSGPARDSRLRGAPRC